MDSVGPLRAEYCLETFIDDLGYKYRRKGQPYVKVKDESYSVTYICMIAKCSASLTFNSKTKDFKKSKKFNHKCSITDHMSRTYSTSIKITDIKTLEEKINQDPMKPYQLYTKKSQEQVLDLHIAMGHLNSLPTKLSKNSFLN